MVHKNKKRIVRPLLKAQERLQRPRRPSQCTSSNPTSPEPPSATSPDSPAHVSYEFDYIMLRLAETIYVFYLSKLFLFIRKIIN